MNPFVWFIFCQGLSINFFSNERWKQHLLRKDLQESKLSTFVNKWFGQKCPVQFCSQMMHFKPDINTSHEGTLLWPMTFAIYVQNLPFNINNYSSFTFNSFSVQFFIQILNNLLKKNRFKNSNILNKFFLNKNMTET